MSYDTDDMYMDGATAAEILAAVRAGHLGGHDYDYANIVSMACEKGAIFLDKVLSGIENLGANVDTFAWETDRDHLTAMSLYAGHHADIAIVMAKHGVDTRPLWETNDGLSDTDISTLKEIASTAKRAKALIPPTPDYAEPLYITLSRLANEIAGSAMRKDGAARICEHAGAAVRLLEKWGVDKDDAALAWLLGILDVAENGEESSVIREEIRHATRETMGSRGLSIVDGLRWGSPTHSWNGEEELIRAIAIADSVCLVREWLGGDEKRRQMATWRHNASRTLFEELDKVTEVKYPGLFKERIPAELALLEEERENWGDELYCRRRGGIPVECSPIPPPPFVPKCQPPPSSSDAQGEQAETRDNPVEKPATPSIPQVLVEQPAIPRITLEEVPEPANHGLAAFWAFVKSLWRTVPDGPQQERPSRST